MKPARARPGAVQRAAGLAAGGWRSNEDSQDVDPKQTPAPRFELTPTTGKGEGYSSSRRRADRPCSSGPTSFRPTIELDGDHVVFAVSPEAAKNALAAVRKKDWKPSGDLAKVCENVADNLVLLGVNDVSDTLPPVLASLPGTLQTMINTSCALAKAKDGTDAGASQADGRRRRAGEAAGAAGRRGGMALPGGGMQAPRRREARPRRRLRAGERRTKPTAAGFKLERHGVHRRRRPSCSTSMPRSCPRPAI